MRGSLHRACRRRFSRGFSLLEVMVAMGVFSLLLAILLSVIRQTSTVWKRSSEKIEAFQGARIGFDLLTRNLSQATLNTYLDYDSTTAPTRYLRKSELAFVCAPAGTSSFPGTANTGQAVFFQAPLGYSAVTDNAPLTSLLNPCGYYISFSTNTDIPAHVLTSSAASNPSRYRLMQLLVPAESNAIYSSGSNSMDWFLNNTSKATIVADNVILLVLRPQDPGSTAADITTNYTYNTETNAADNPQPVTANQLPPVIQVTMVAIDENSAKRLENGSSQPVAIQSALAGKFQISSDSAFQKDLADLEAALVKSKIEYRVFSSAVPIRESKWSK
ncbi:MAG: Verru_Chthon cassette protein C [Chthoniobacteraceae bacterium]